MAPIAVAGRFSTTFRVSPYVILSTETFKSKPTLLTLKISVMLSIRYVLLLLSAILFKTALYFPQSNRPVL